MKRMQRLCVENTQERVCSYAMCTHWLDMPSPLLARPTIPMAGPTNSIPQTSHWTLFIEQPFCAWKPRLQYDWNSRFHTQAPGLHLFSVCLIPGGQSLQLAGAELCSPNSSHLNTLSVWLILAQSRKIAQKKCVMRNTFIPQFCPT